MSDLRKTDLHLHLDGSLSYELIRKLALEIGYDFQGKTVRQLSTAPASCNSLAEYLQCFAFTTLLLQTEKSLMEATYDLIKRLDSDHLEYAEIRFAPQLHTKNGLTQQKAVDAVLKGLGLAQTDNLGIKIGIILCMMVNGTHKENAETAELSAAYLGKGVVGLDLAGPEGAAPLTEFGELFHAAYRANVPFTIHAGECGDYNNVAKAIAMGARRIGHGCGAVYSKECIALLRRERVVVETCPSSNLQTKAVLEIEKHPIRTFLEEGILVTVNTDNMTVSDTSLEKEYHLLKKYLGFSDVELRRMNETALNAGFLSIS